MMCSSVAALWFKCFGQLVQMCVYEKAYLKAYQYGNRLQTDLLKPLLVLFVQL